MFLQAPYQLKCGTWIQLLGNEVGKSMEKTRAALGVDAETLWGPQYDPARPDRGVDWAASNRVADAIFAQRTLEEWEPILAEHDVWYERACNERRTHSMSLLMFFPVHTHAQLATLCCVRVDCRRMIISFIPKPHSCCCTLNSFVLHPHDCCRHRCHRHRRRFVPVKRFEDHRDPTSPAYAQSKAVGVFTDAESHPEISQHDLLATPVKLRCAPAVSSFNPTESYTPIAPCMRTHCHYTHSSPLPLPADCYRLRLGR